MNSRQCILPPATGVRGSAPASGSRFAVLGADGDLGGLLAGGLLDRGGGVIDFARVGDCPAEIGAAEVLVLLAAAPSRLFDDYEADLTAAAALADALRGSAVRRLVVLSRVGAGFDADDARLHARAEADWILAGAGVPATILRCAPIYGPPDEPGPLASSLLTRRARRALVPGDGRRRIAPLYLGDAVSALLAAATRPEAPTGAFDLVGPEAMSIDDFVRGLNGGQVRFAHLPAPLARAASYLLPSWNPSLVDLLLQDVSAVPDPSHAVESFGLTLHRLADVWATAAPTRGEAAAT
jgi:nucleoside-diphosphate-sugar epimerase